MASTRVGLVSSMPAVLSLRWPAIIASYAQTSAGLTLSRTVSNESIVVSSLWIHQEYSCPPRWKSATSFIRFLIAVSDCDGNLSSTSSSLRRRSVPVFRNSS